MLIRTHKPDRQRYLIQKFRSFSLSLAFCSSNLSRSDFHLLYFDTTYIVAADPAVSDISAIPAGKRKLFFMALNGILVGTRYTASCHDIL